MTFIFAIIGSHRTENKAKTHEQWNSLFECKNLRLVWKTNRKLQYSSLFFLVQFNALVNQVMQTTVFVQSTFQFNNLLIKFDKTRAQTETPK